MKILVVTPKYYPDNFPIIPICETFASLGHDVTVITSFPFDATGDYLQSFPLDEIYNGVNIHRVVARPRGRTRSSLIKNYISVGKELERWCKSTNEEFDIVYTYGISPVTTFKAGRAYKKRFPNAKLVGHVLDIWPENVVAAGFTSRISLLYRYLYRLSKKLYSSLDEIVVGSPSFISYFKTVLNITDKRFHYINQPGLISKQDEYDNPYNDSNIKFLYSGNISTLQCIDYLVKAFELANIPNTSLYIIGNGKDANLLLNQIKESNRKDDIHYIEGMSYKDLAPYIYHADASIVSLKNETFTGKTIPNKLISSMFYGKPIIGMISGDGKNVIVESGGGFIVDQSIVSLSEGFNKIAALSSEDKSLMIKHNTEYYCQNFDVNIIVDKLLSVFNSKQI